VLSGPDRTANFTRHRRFISFKILRLQSAFYVLPKVNGTSKHEVIPPVPKTEIKSMLGWMIVFGLIALLSAGMIIIAAPVAASVAARLATLIFGALFVACLLTQVGRGRA
jgi:hypothetical protein